MTNKHPRLSAHVRRRKTRRIVTYYVYDMRGTGESDIPFGTDYEEALKKWNEAHNRKPRITGTLEEAFGRWEAEAEAEAEALLLYGNSETRKGYSKSLRHIRPLFGPMTWESIELVHLKGYLKRRTAKTQGNREMALLSVIWNWARGRRPHVHAMAGCGHGTIEVEEQGKR